MSTKEIKPAPDSPQPALAGAQTEGKTADPDYTKTVAIQILIPTTAFPGLPVGTKIEKPTPEQIRAALEVKSCVHFSLPE